jgi:uncharacterized protein (DUF2236 family)
VTADLHAAPTGLIERSAAAYMSGVPEDAGDDGLFGPASVTWRASADRATPVAGQRSLLMQALHPLAMAGVDQHSGSASCCERTWPCRPPRTSPTPWGR